MKKYLPHIVASLILFSFLGVGLQTIYADGSNVVSGGIPNPFNCGGASNCTINTLFTSIINNIVLPLGGVLAVLAFIWVGFMFVTARGNSAKLETARDALLYVAIGTAVLLGAWIIQGVISNTINQL